MWTRLVLVRALLVLGLASWVTSAGAQAPNPDSSGPAAVLEGSPIPLRSVGDHHCRDLARPVVRCFLTAAQRDADIEVLIRDRALDSTPYVVVFQHEDYGGPSISFSADQANLALVGWNDAITSFKSLNGGHPKFWENASYGTPSWQWAAGAWVSNVGSGANDKFSSLKDVP